VKRAIIALLILLSSTSVWAATFDFRPCTPAQQNCFLIKISDELRYEDSEKFARQIKLRKVDAAMVTLDSPGGSVVAAIEIGRIIRAKAYQTFVGSSHDCTSACGIIWLAGAKRFGESRTLIGFHAASITEHGKTTETGMGNALVGAYLRELGLSYDAIARLTVASPDDMSWLSISDVRALGIDAQIYNPASPPPRRASTSTRAVEPNSVVQAEQGYDWQFIVNSTLDDVRAIELGKSLQVFVDREGNKNVTVWTCKIDVDLSTAGLGTVLRSADQIASYLRNYKCREDMLRVHINCATRVFRLGASAPYVFEPDSLGEKIAQMACVVQR
jgi:hypothetical protein